jgi:hypothetical protein
MRWLRLFLISIAITVFGVSSVQAATQISIKSVSAVGVSTLNSAVAVTLSRAATTATEGAQYSVVVKLSDSAITAGKADALLAGQNPISINATGAATTHYTVYLLHRVNGVNKQVGNPVKVVSKASTTPTSDPTKGGTSGNGTDTNGTINSQASQTNCYKFRNVLFTKSGEDGICADDFLTRAYLWAVGLAILGAVGMIIYAGYKYAVSRGNPSEINNAKEIIISTLVGLALLVLSYTILSYLGVKVFDSTSNNGNNPNKIFNSTTNNNTTSTDSTSTNTGTVPDLPVP